MQLVLCFGLGRCMVDFEDARRCIVKCRCPRAKFRPLTSMYGSPPVTCSALGGGMLQGIQLASRVEEDVQVSLNMPMGQPLVLHA